MRRSETAPLLRQNLRLSRRFCLSEASFVWDVPSQTHVPGKNKIPDNPRWRAFYSRCVGDFPCGHFPVLLPKAMTRSPSLQEIRGRPRLDCAAGPLLPLREPLFPKGGQHQPQQQQIDHHIPPAGGQEGEHQRRGQGESQIIDHKAHCLQDQSRQGRGGQQASSIPLCRIQRRSPSAKRAVIRARRASPAAQPSSWITRASQ